MSRHALIADIGGTNTRVALSVDGTIDEGSIRRYRNSDHAGLDAVLALYRQDFPHSGLDGICVDIAGPVHDGKGTLTNLDWTLTEALLAQWSGASHAVLINDLQAQGHGAADLPPESLAEVVPGQPAPPHATRLVVNVGTGFNAAVVYDGPQGRMVPPSESGHLTMPVRTQADLGLCRFIESAHGFAAIEDVLSGRGLERVHYWLGLQADDPQELRAADVIAAAQADPHGRAAEATRIFTRILGTVTGNLALVHLPFGGIFLVGGVVRALGPKLQTLGFAEALHDKGRFSGMVAGFAVHVIEDDYAALRGAARHMDAHLQISRSA